MTSKEMLVSLSLWVLMFKLLYVLVSIPLKASRESLVFVDALASGDESLDFREWFSHRGVWYP